MTSSQNQSRNKKGQQIIFPQPFLSLRYNLVFTQHRTDPAEARIYGARHPEPGADTSSPRAATCVTAEVGLHGGDPRGSISTGPQPAAALQRSRGCPHLRPRGTARSCRPFFSHLSSPRQAGSRLPGGNPANSSLFRTMSMIPFLFYLLGEKKETCDQRDGMCTYSFSKCFTGCSPRFPALLTCTKQALLAVQRTQAAAEHERLFLPRMVACNELAQPGCTAPGWDAEGLGQPSPALQAVPSPGLRCASRCGRSPGIAVTPGRGRLQEGPPPLLLRAAGPTDQSSCWVLLRAALSTQLRQPASQHWLRPRLYLQRKIKVLSGLNGQTRAKPRRKEVVSAEH